MARESQGDHAQAHRQVVRGVHHQVEYRFAMCRQPFPEMGQNLAQHVHQLIEHGRVGWLSRCVKSNIFRIKKS